MDDIPDLARGVCQASHNTDGPKEEMGAGHVSARTSRPMSPASPELMPPALSKPAEAELLAVPCDMEHPYVPDQEIAHTRGARA